MLNEAITIKEKFRLTEIDLCSLDYTKPVYLRQYGKYYGVVTIQTSSADECEAELMQLPQNIISDDDLIAVELHKSYSWVGGAPSIDDTISATITGAGVYIVGSVVTVVADGGDQWEFESWYDAGTQTVVSAMPTYSFVAPDDVETMELIAVFV